MECLALNCATFIKLFSHDELLGIVLQVQIRCFYKNESNNAYYSYFQEGNRILLSITFTITWDPIIPFNPATFSYLSQGGTWICIDIYRGLFILNILRWEGIVRFVDIGGIVDHYCFQKEKFKDAKETTRSRKSNNTMTKRKEQTMIYKTLHRKLKIEQHETH